MRTSDMIKSKFIRGKDLQGKPAMVLTIADVTEEITGGRGGRSSEVKCVLWFMEDHRGLSINKARVAALEYAYGPESDMWTGKRVKLSYDPTITFGDKAVGGVKLQTSPGVVYNPAQNPHDASWGGPAPGAAPGGAASPPVPVLNPATGQWELPAQRPAAPAPPVPVLNPATGQWELPAQKHVPPPTISQRVAAGQPSRETIDTATGEVVPEFDDEIPF